MAGFAPYYVSWMNENKERVFEMNDVILRNHQYNAIRKQLAYLQHASDTVTDPRIVASVRIGTQTAVAEQLQADTATARRLLEAIPTLRQAEDFQAFLREVETLLVPFPAVAAQEIRKLFPKHKKLNVPDLSSPDRRFVSYIAWVDPSNGRQFLVYPLDGTLVGIDGRWTATGKKGVCFLCNRHEDTALFTAHSKARPAHAPPDYYKALGNYMCTDSLICNRNIADVQPLERFLRQITGEFPR